MKHLFAIALLFVAAAAGAAPPTNCNYPEVLQAVEPATNVKNSINQERCIINELQVLVGDGGGGGGLLAGEAECANVTANAGQQLGVTITVPTSVDPGDVVLVSATDPTVPPRLQAFYVSSSGTTVTTSVFNHDAQSARTGQVCAMVVKP